jgi:hypothetical protein
MEVVQEGVQILLALPIIRTTIWKAILDVRRWAGAKVQIRGEQIRGGQIRGAL